MTENHPITPTPELRQLWAQQAQRMDPRDPVAWLEHVATQAARWAADQELEACCEFLDDNELCDPNFHKDLRAARRPKPLSLKEQALEVLENVATYELMGCAKSDNRLSEKDAAVIRQALEQLPND